MTLKPIFLGSLAHKLNLITNLPPPEAAQCRIELYDLLNYPGNIIQTLFLNDEPAFFHVYPVAPDCGEPYPTYASLSAYAEEHNLHYFRKFADSNYVIVTETLRQRFRQAKLKGASFLLKFDGKRSWPAI